MAVGLGEMPVMHPVKGFELGVTNAGIKQRDRRDLVLMRCAEGSQVAGVYTQNTFCAAPVLLCKQRMGQPVRYLITNTGNANAATGKPGLAAAEQVCQALAEQLDVQAEQVLPFSTGVVGEQLCADTIITALPAVISDLREDNWAAAAEGIMTTDTLPKGASRQFEYQGQTVTVTGISKGAGMIRPNMATMLGYIATDAQVAAPVLQALVKEAANLSFNRITIDGDTSTNDSFMLVATGQAGLPEITASEGELYQLLRDTVVAVAMQLAQAIVRDGEGATKFVTVQVEQGDNHQECLDVAYAIAHSPLIKTALFASDPNWGRIVVAIGNAGLVDLQTERVNVFLNDVCIVEQGGRAASYTEEQGSAAMHEEEITIRIELGRGHAQEVIWTSDLSHEYVRINAEYRT